MTEAANTHTISNCEIRGNTATLGGGIYNYKGTLTINGATIGNASATAVATESACSNKATDSGGGIYNEGGTVNFSGGNISYNYAKYGGGIYNSNTANSKLIMGSSCTAIIDHNLSAGGGGIYTQNTFTMEAGEITSNSALSGGGIYINIGCTTTISGGTISGNKTLSTPGKGAGICNTGTLNFSGAAALDSDDDVYLFDDTYITITGDLTGTASVAKITPASYATGTQVLEGTTARVSGNYSKFAVSDSSWHIDSEGKLAQ